MSATDFPHLGARVVVGRYLFGTDIDLTGRVGTVTGVSDWRAFPISVDIDGHGLALFGPGELDAACGYSLGHRCGLLCDCVCVRPAGHDGPHQCSAEAVQP